jgi:hypothetical protein
MITCPSSTLHTPAWVEMFRKRLLRTAWLESPMGAPDQPTGQLGPSSVSWAQISPIF